LGGEKWPADEAIWRGFLAPITYKGPDAPKTPLWNATAGGGKNSETREREKRHTCGATVAKRVVGARLWFMTFQERGV
jgi:hypothetical protein